MDFYETAFIAKRTRGASVTSYNGLLANANICSKLYPLRHESGKNWIPAYAEMTEKGNGAKVSTKGRRRSPPLSSPLSPSESLFSPLPMGEGQGEGKKPSAQSLNNSKNPLPHRTVPTAARLWLSASPRCHPAIEREISAQNSRHSQTWKRRTPQ